jgi:hypothetical protein
MLPLKTNMERFFACLLRSRASDFVTADNDVASLRAVYNNRQPHFNVRAALVMEEACLQRETVCTTTTPTATTEIGIAGGWWARQTRMDTSKLLSRINNGATLPNNSFIFDQEG